MAYAAVLYLHQILEQISNPHLEQHQTPLQDQQIKSLQEKLKFLLDFLDDSWRRRSEELRCLEREIRDAAYKIEDMMESHVSKNFGEESFHKRQIRDQTFCENFVIVADEIDSIKTKAAKLKELWGATDMHQSQRTSLPTGQSRLPSIGKNDMDGFRKDLMEIMDRLTGYPPALQIIQVTGMGGISKTTLARNVYNDPLIEHHFPTRAWVSISQEYHEREVLLSLLDSTKQLNAEMHKEKSTEELKEYLYKSLKGRRYLVVMDDVWTTEAWDSFSRIFPDDRIGSRIMLTTRLLRVVESHSSPHRMQFLNKTDSWNLLRREVFGEDCCPLELEEAGKEIAENCKGLPLSLVVIGGHLSNANRTKDHWEYVAQNVKPVVTSTDANCSEILSLSYDYLPHYLKACFLYMGVFPENDKIRVSKLIKLWVESHSSPHRMQFLNKTDSWNLLRREVFGEDCCPLELEEAGKEIAENCKGLPLSLVVIGGHLSNANRTKDHWEYVAQNVKPVVTSTDANCSEMLSLSYDYLPHYLKVCFLCMGVFPENDKIRVSKLIKLWAAEGFLKPVRGKTLEEVGEEYLGDLISRNLILISKKSSSGKIKTCSIHDLLRDLCMRKAQQDMFFHVTVTDKYFGVFAEGIKYSRRLCIHQDIFHKELSNGDTSNVNPSMGSLPPVRSILCSRSASKIYESGDQKLVPLLRVLDLAEGKVDGFPIGGMKLVHARYLAFSCDGRISIPKILPSFLWYLQTLIVDCEEVQAPGEIWRMPQLRHLLFRMCFLPSPARSPIDGQNIVLCNLLTLSKVSSSSCTKEVFERVPNLNKLGISIAKSRMTSFSLVNLVNLPQLENLKIISERERVSVPMNFTFPPNIKKLTLKGCEIPWKHMTIVGSMPNLEVLKLRSNAFDGPEWEPTEGEFCKLKFLLLHGIHLVQWRADQVHFPRLEHLILRACFKLEEIPCSIGDIPTLQIIDLDDASPSAVISAKQIKEECYGSVSDPPPHPSRVRGGGPLHATYGRGD